MDKTYLTPEQQEKFKAFGVHINDLIVGFLDANPDIDQCNTISMIFLAAFEEDEDTSTSLQSIFGIAGTIGTGICSVATSMVNDTDGNLAKILIEGTKKHLVTKILDTF